MCTVKKRKNVTNVVMVKVDIMGVFILSRGEMDFLSIFDMVLEASVIDHVVLWLGSVAPRLVCVGRLFREGGSDHPCHLHRWVV
jgi:hypothetical protein